MVSQFPLACPARGLVQHESNRPIVSCQGIQLPFGVAGADDFSTFFWDGRVDARSGQLISQFGDEPPSSDPLVVAVHLPPVETLEMLEFDNVVERYRTETVEGARGLYEIITKSLRNKRPDLISELSDKLGKSPDQVEFVDIARSIAAFIREKFTIRETKLHRFAFNNGPLSSREIQGGLIFFGKGRCVVCHSGPHFSDFRFYTVPFPQLGQGKNGFGSTMEDSTLPMIRQTSISSARRPFGM